MPPKDSKSLAFLECGKWVTQGFADGLQFAEDIEPVILGVDLAKGGKPHRHDRAARLTL